MPADYKNFNENDSLVMLLDRSTRCMGINLQRIFKNKGFDITVEQWMILLLLWSRNGRTQQEIADRIGKDKGTISPQIDGLEKRRLIVRVQDDQDKRRNWIRLTRKGKALEEKLVPLGFANMAIAQQGIPEEDLKICRSVLQQVCRNFEESNAASEKPRTPNIKEAVP